ncbi:MAG: GNAT family N-acetyltransferase [Aquabacterium sp.]|uniref:acyl-homoserine-lactone synthase n=1 Tax=Aquabacterium sp. TaxID=1872578 RepID=UPI00120C7380|nr:acyl-homoserine-lactone synthase [Aquabacterium sp.]TAK96783.1 MAG: GNAT family N-acetyltransferase [Aquabacterium sp.]
MNIITGAQEGLPQGLYNELGTYRHSVFVELLGWDLETPEGFEEDQFDRPDTEYIVAKNSEDAIIGCARLLPTARPYLLGEVFPELLDGAEPPCLPDVWELSRFAATDLRGGTQVEYGKTSSIVAVALLRNTVKRAAELGAKNLIAVVSLGAERLMKLANFQVHRAGPPMVLRGHPLVACWIEVTA